MVSKIKLLWIIVSAGLFKSQIAFLSPSQQLQSYKVFDIICWIIAIEVLCVYIAYVYCAVPMECPTNVSVIKSSIGSTSVELTWNAVSERPDTVRGFFIGYRVLHSLTDLSSYTLYFHWEYIPRWFTCISVLKLSHNYQSPRSTQAFHPSGIGKSSIGLSGWG